MSDLRTVLALKDSVQLMESLLENKPAAIACDLHPRYNTTTVAEALAKEAGVPLLKVQHHYAHILSCMVENDWQGPVIGVSFDGTGYGTDGTLWGGEFLLADYRGFSRLGSIEPFWQAGGDRSSREGWRIAVSLLRDSLVRELQGSSPADIDAAWKEQCLALGLCDEKEFAAQSFMLQHRVNCIESTSAGRLFDGVSALLGLRRQATFEGEASMALQFAAERGEGSAEDLHYTLHEAADGRFLLPTTALFGALVTLHEQGRPARELARLFHQTLAELIGAGCERARQQTGVTTVALSGGVFQNTLLTRLTKERLEATGFKVLLHSLLPPNDGGICVGQAAFAMYALQES